MVNAALYGRVSTDLQEKEGTIQSQLEALRAHAGAHDYTVVAEYIDDGHSGAALARPGLDALRDAMRTGAFTAVLFHSPDRLARRALYQEIVVEEMRQAGVQPVFLNFTADDSPEGRMMLGMQGLFAEYDRTKIAERTRRGKMYWAKNGALVGHYAPYGYRFNRRTETERASMEPDEDQATVVKQIFQLLVNEHLSVRSIARRLSTIGTPTARGAIQWHPSTVDRMLRNTAYKGSFYYHKMETGTANDPAHPHAGSRARPSEEWIEVKVLPIIDERLWDAAQAQLSRNTLLSPRNNKRHKYLLKGLIKCPRCGFAYTGAVRKDRRSYRCTRTDIALSSTGIACSSGSFSADLVEGAVWEAVADALRHPERLAAEHERSLKMTGVTTSLEAEYKQASAALKKLTTQEDRVTAAYVGEVMDLERYRDEMDKISSRRVQLEKVIQDLETTKHQERDSRQTLAHLKTFCDEVSVGLDAMTFEERQQLLRLVIDRVTVDNGVARIETRIPGPSPQDQLRLHDPEPVEGRTDGRAYR